MARLRSVVPRTGIVIVNYNAGVHLERCLASVTAHAPAVPVVVVDNASHDGSEGVAARTPRVRLVRNATNAGFGTAVNQGVAVLPPGLAVLLLNPDCELTAGVLDALEAELVAHPECAVAAPTILDEDGSIQGNVRGDPTILTGLFGRTTVLSRWFPNAPAARRNVQRASPHADDERTADWVSGACMLLRREAFEAVGGFDERYFLYWEDADLCRRLRARGHTVRFVPTATIVHVGGRSSASAKALSIRAFHDSAFLYYRTHVARNGVTRLIAWLLLTIRRRVKLAGLQQAAR